jgi:uncharacterized protein (UPF0335 family)
MSGIDTLTEYVHQIEQLEDERSQIAEKVKQKYQELKVNGFSVTIVREVIKRRKKARDEVEEADTLLTMYESAIGDDNG